MTTNVATDLRIDGDGFFAVSPTATQEVPYLTRAGNFTHRRHAAAGERRRHVRAERRTASRSSLDEGHHRLHDRARTA